MNTCPSENCVLWRVKRVTQHFHQIWKRRLGPRRAWSPPFSLWESYAHGSKQHAASRAVRKLMGPALGCCPYRVGLIQEEKLLKRVRVVGSTDLGLNSGTFFIGSVTLGQLLSLSKPRLFLSYLLMVPASDLLGADE